MNTTLLIWLIPVPPLISFLLIVLFANRTKALSHSIALTSVIMSWIMSWIVVFSAFAKGYYYGENPFHSYIHWLPTGTTYLDMGVAVDNLNSILLFFVPLCIVAIFLYSIGYSNFGKPVHDHDLPGTPPHHGVDPLYSRFFAFLSLFAGAMLTLTVADNLLLLFVGWEVMGLCSYLLIGFWYGREYDDPKATPPRIAAIKAFLTTRVADVMMLLGIAYLYSQAGTLNFHDIFFNEELMYDLTHNPSMIAGFTVANLIGLLLFIGTVGKSAQFPLHVWLPDAMEGPTPVSAMIHAAAMVSAGIYMIIRMFPIISAGGSHGPNPTMEIITFIGAFTALFGATIAIAQYDVKRVLAYSTISQLGFMVAALGMGAYVAATFHLMTHAFFKALLFMGSGSIIHGVEHGMHDVHEHIDPQDMRNMGGLKSRMPITYWTFLIGGLALSGFPFVTAGFWSKDEILGDAWAHHHYIVFTVLCIAAFLTAYYTMRQISLTFYGEPRTKSAEHAHENNWTMTLPLVVLSFFAIFAGFIGVHGEFPVLGQLFGNNPFEHWLVGALPKDMQPKPFTFTWFPVIMSIAVALGGLLVGYLVYGRNPLKSADQVDPVKKLLGPLWTMLENKYYVDEFYYAAFVKPAHWIGETLTFKIIDRGIIDGIIHFVASFFWKAGVGSAAVEQVAVDAPPDRMADGVRWTGDAMKYIQTGRIQNYLMYTVIAIALIGVLFGFLVAG